MTHSELLEATDVLQLARCVLSGKRVALVGFGAEAASELTSLIADAEGFTRSLSPQQVLPSSDVLKPFEIILVDADAATGTAWLEPEQVSGIAERCVAAGTVPVLLRLLSESSISFKEYCVSTRHAEEWLLRCVLGMRRPARQAQPTIPANSTVVLADDDSSVTAIVRRALERNGLTCEIATTGTDALALISRVKPCAAILDVHMPTIDGFEVLSRIKSSPELAQTRVILLTGSEQEADIIRGFSLGAEDYVCKPFNPMELTIRLMRVIGRI